MSVLELTCEKIRIKCIREMINIEGDNLQIEYMNEDDLKITGIIKHIRIIEVNG